jgi:GTP-binding protein HflX
MGVVNTTLQELKAFDKPIITIFNKMDLYEKQTFDPWLEEEVRAELISELREKWMRETNDKAVFISATERMNVEELRSSILNAVKEAYKVRYPYRTEYFF